GAAIRDKDRIIEIKDEWDLASDHPFEDRWPKQRGFTKDINCVEVLGRSNIAKPSAESPQNMAQLFAHLPLPVEHRRKLFIKKRRVRNLDAALAQQRFPLLDSKSLARR